MTIKGGMYRELDGQVQEFAVFCNTPVTQGLESISPARCDNYCMLGMLEHAVDWMHKLPCLQIHALDDVWRCMMSQQVSFDWVSKQISSQLHLYR